MFLHMCMSFSVGKGAQQQYFYLVIGHGTPTYIVCMGLCVFYILYDRADIVCQTLLFSYFTP